MGSAGEDLFAALRAAAAGVAGAGSAEQLRSCAVHGSLAVLDLKARNREVYEGLEVWRTGTADAKQALEKTNLQLQNLEYEKSHYAKEIKTCRDFRSAFSDDAVGLAPEEEFLRRAPPELNADADAAQPNSGHARMLNRLAFELAGARRGAGASAHLRVCASPPCPEPLRAHRARRAQGAGRAAAGAEDAQEGAAGDEHKPQKTRPRARDRAQGAQQRRRCVARSA
jgi:hypothetical protein